VRAPSVNPGRGAGPETQASGLVIRGGRIGSGHNSDELPGNTGKWRHYGQ